MNVITRTRTRALALTFAVALALGFGLSACGGSSSGGSASGGTQPAAQSSADAQSAALVKYAQCMRSNGLTSFPDPVNGRLQLQVTKGGALDPSSPAYQAAQKACQALEPPGLQSGGSQSTAQQEQALKFVDCMRSNGVPDFPEPVNGRFLISGGQVNPNSPGFQKAMQACRDLAPAGAAAGGQ